MGDPLAVLATAALVVAVVAAAAPRWALTLLLAALAFALHHPSTAPTVLLVVLTGVFELVYAVRTRPSPRRAWHAVASQPLLLLCALFVVAAWLSLSSLPLASIWGEHAQAWSHAASPRDAFNLVLNWLLFNETRREFALTSVVLTLQGFVMALIVWRESRASSVVPVRLAAAIVVGLTVSIVLGILEAFGGLSLAALRGDSAGSVGLRPGTMQSLAGNPGWLSQYLVYTLPYALVLLVGSSAARRGAVALAVLSGVTAFALVVIFQRGGWVAGLVVLIYVAFAASRLLRLDSSLGRTRTLAWRAVAYAAVVLALVLTGFSAWTRAVSPSGTPFDVSAYLARLTSIASGDRIPYVIAGTEIGALHPVLGAGHESFAYRYSIYFDRPGGPFHHLPVRVPVPSSAHSIYLQTFSGTGSVGFALVVAIFLTAAVTAVRAWRSPHLDRAHRVVLAGAAGSLLGMACYGLVQEIFYVHALRLLFFVAVGLVAAAGNDLIRWPAALRPALWAVLAAAFAAHLMYEYVWPGPDRLLASSEPTGLYAADPRPEFASMRWSSDEAAWPVPAGARRFALRVRSFAPYPQQVQLRMCGVERTTSLSDHDWHTLEGALEGCGAGDYLRLSVTPTWSPPSDARALGVVTADVRID